MKKKKLKLDLEIRKLTKSIMKGEYGTEECHKGQGDETCYCFGNHGE